MPPGPALDVLVSHDCGRESMQIEQALQTLGSMSRKFYEWAHFGLRALRKGTRKKKRLRVPDEKNAVPPHLGALNAYPGTY